jgi:hypothetical protein
MPLKRQFGKKQPWCIELSQRAYLKVAKREIFVTELFTVYLAIPMWVTWELNQNSNYVKCKAGIRHFVFFTDYWVLYALKIIPCLLSMRKKFFPRLLSIIPRGSRG